MVSLVEGHFSGIPLSKFSGECFAAWLSSRSNQEPETSPGELSETILAAELRREGPSFFSTKVDTPKPIFGGYLMKFPADSHEPRINGKFFSGAVRSQLFQAEPQNLGLKKAGQKWYH